ncbi:hypothetical protein MTO96_015239 [Rhipicephalus appendiculatus]
MRNPCSSKAVVGRSTNAHASSSVAQQTKIAGHCGGHFRLDIFSVKSVNTIEQHTQPASPLQVQGFLTRHRVSSQGKTTSWKPAEEASWADVELFFFLPKNTGPVLKGNVHKEQVHSIPVPTYHQEQGEPPK